MSGYSQTYAAHDLWIWKLGSSGQAVGSAAQGKGGRARGPIGEQLVLAMKRVDTAY